VDGLKGRQFQRLGQLLATRVGRGGQTGPAALGELAIGVGEARCRDHVPVGEDRTLLVADPVQRGQHAFGELRRRLKHRAEQVGVIVRKGTRGRDLVDPGDGLEGEGEIANGGAVGHEGRALLSVGWVFMPPCRNGMQAALGVAALLVQSVPCERGKEPWLNRATVIRPSR
jgi:hypothetical protein